MSQIWNQIKNKAFIRQSFKLWSTDWFLKAISLWLAVVLWFLVGGEDSIEKTVQIPVEIINLPRELVISNQYKREIEVSVTGPRSVILDMNEQKISRQVDLSNATPGTLVVENDNDHINVPRSVTVQRVQPASIILSIDKLVQKNFPVVANTVGVVANGYEVKMIRMNPDFINITGPETVLGDTEELKSRYISLNGLNKSEQLQVPLDLSPAMVDLIGETSVTADIEVGPIFVRKTVENLPIEFVKHGVKSSVSPDKVTVTAFFPQLLLEDVESPAELLVAKAVPNEAGENLKVIVSTKTTKQLPIEIISISPATVEKSSDVPIAETSYTQEPVQEIVVDNVLEKVGDEEPEEIDEIPASEIAGPAVIKALNNKRKYKLQ